MNKDMIIAAAKEYRKFGWNVIPLCGYQKSPSSSPYVKKNGWKDLEGRTLTENEFNAAFAAPDLTGVGLITGAISRTIVIDEDSYKEGGMKVAFQSPMVSQTASGGRHIFGKYTAPVKTLGFRKGVNVEGKADGGFIVLPPSQVYRKGADGKLSKELGEYKWLSRCTWDQLPIISEKVFDTFKPEESQTRVQLEEHLSAEIGDQHNSLRTICLWTFNRFPPEEWDIAERFIRAEADKFKPPHPQWRVEKMIRDTKDYILDHPKEAMQILAKQKKVAQAVRTMPVEYSKMTDEQLEEIEEREELHTGLPIMDSLLPFKTGYYVVCANPGAGKGWFATWLAKQFFIIHMKRSVFFSLEMAETLVRTRLLQQWSGLTEEQLIGGNVMQAKNLMRQNALLVYPFGQDDGAYQTPENFLKDVMEFYSQGYRIFFFDHLHELEGANDNTKNQRVIEEWGKMFQTLCKEYKDIWLFIFAQPNGAAAKKAVLGRTDIAGSKSITQKCEVFISLNRKVLADERDLGQIKVDEQDRQVLVWIDKNRLSSKQKVGAMLWLSKTGNFTEFKDIDVLVDTLAMTPPEAVKTPEQIDLLEGKEEREVN